MKSFWLFSLACLLGASAATAAIPDPVRIDTGQISGATLSSGIRAFKGIPYAAPPVGDLRWKAPQPAADWAGVRKTEEFGSVCMQNRRQGAPAASEDCLYLNVWTGAESAKEKRPVFFWIYGGGFYTGSGSEPRYDGEALAKKGIVVVTINYRLGAFGFFSHPELSKESGRNSSGNYGVMDMVSALKWTQKNIAKFGGDPARVTIGGESAGAIAVAALVGSPEGKGLFKRAISQSGAWMGINIAKTKTLADAEQSGVKLAAKLSAPTLAQLREVPAQDLFKAGGNGDGLIVDGKYIPEDLSAIFLHKKQNDVDVLVGSNHDEGTFFVRNGTVKATDFLADAKTRFGDATDSYLKTHPASSDAEAYTSRLNSVRDEMGWHMRTYAQVQSERGKAKAYLYYFTRIPPSAPGQPSRGATHTAELRYMFNNLGDDPRQPVTDLDRKVADEMSSYWANFVISGNPNGKGLPEWPAYNAKKSTEPMVFGDTVGVGAGIDNNVLAFFDNYYAKQ